MRDGTITTHADVYTEGIPGTSYSIITSSDPSPPLHTTIPMVSYDIPDDAQAGKVTPTSPTAPIMSKFNGDTDTEMIENAVPITHTVLPTPEPRPKIERNGFDLDVKSNRRTEDTSCVVDCIYFTQQCCECVIL